MTGRGIWLEAALSRNTSGLPFTSRSRIGKSARTRATSSASAALSAALSIAVIVPVLSLHRGAGLRHHRPLEALDDRAHRYALDDRRAEGVRQQVAGGALRQPAAAQVEQLLGVELADRGAVGALHVVGKDLE